MNSGRKCLSTMSVNNQSHEEATEVPSFLQGSALLWLIPGCVFFGASFLIGTPLIQSKYDPGPSFISMVLGIILLIGGVCILLARVMTKVPTNAHSSASHSIKLIGLVLAYITSIPFIGFQFATFVFGITSMCILRVGRRLSCVATVLLILVVHLVFFEMFGIQLPEFLLLEYLGS